MLVPEAAAGALATTIAGGGVVTAIIGGGWMPGWNCAGMPLPLASAVAICQPLARSSGWITWESSFSALVASGRPCAAARTR